MAEAPTINPDSMPSVSDQPEQEKAEDRPASRESDHAEWWNSPDNAPLFYWPVANVPVEEKLARMREALENGSDPNEVDHSTDRREQQGRPLHMCMNPSKEHSGSGRFLDNAPVIKLLLDYGADPRLYGVPSNPHMMGYPKRPVDDARLSLESVRKWKDEFFTYPGGKDRQMAFYEEAYRLMKEAEDRLDGKQTSRCTLM